MKRKVLGLIEHISIIGEDSKGRERGLIIKAKVDTGASRSSISKNLVKKLNLGPHKKTTLIKSAIGVERRKVIKVRIRLKGKTLKAFFSVANREHMTYGVLIGQNILRMGRFLVDPLKLS